MDVVRYRLKQWIRALPGKPGHRGLWLPKTPSNYIKRMAGMQRYSGDIAPPPPVLTWSVFSGVTSFLGMATIAMIQKYGAAIKNHDLPFAIAPFGATAVLVFGVPAAPLAQPRNVLVGHVLSALVGIFVHEIFKHADDSLMWLPGALAVGIAIGLMGLVNCYHPPAGATAFLAGMASPEVKRVGWWYPLYPVLPVAVIMVVVSVILNNLCRVFPVYWLTPAKMPAEEPASASGEAKLAGARVESATASESSSEHDVERSVTEQAENEQTAEMAWLRERVRELEHEVARLSRK